MQDFYELLGVDRNATKSEVKEAFRAKKNEWQSKLSSKDPSLQTEASNKITELTAAYKAVVANAKEDGVSNISVAPVPPPAPMPAPTFAPVPPPAPMPAPTRESEHAQTSNGNSATLKIIIGILVGIIIAGGGLFFYNNSKGTDKGANPEPSPGKPPISQPKAQTVNPALVNYLNRLHSNEYTLTDVANEINAGRMNRFNYNSYPLVTNFRNNINGMISESTDPDLKRIAEMQRSRLDCMIDGMHGNTARFEQGGNLKDACADTARRFIQRNGLNMSSYPRF